MAPIPAELANNTEETLKLKIREILKSNSINDPISEVHIKDSGLRGENMASVTNYITVNFEDANKAPLNLFAKKHSDSPAHSEMIDGGQLFEKEAMFFMEYLPVARNYCKSKGKEDLLSIYPKCYYADEQMGVFENLVLDKGYTLLNKLERQGMEAAKMSLTNLAKHHAISLAVKDGFGGAEPFFKKFHYFKSFAMTGVRVWVEPGMKSGIETSLSLLRKSGQELKQCNEVINKLEGFLEAGFDFIFDPVKNDTGSVQVLNHGDYWNNNMMFLKDERTGKLTDHIAIDFQVVYGGSPTIDLGYFLYTSVKGKLRRENLPELLKIYLTSFKATANVLGHPIELTLEVVK